MNTIEGLIVMTPTNNTALLMQMGPARTNMAVVEPVAIPILPPPPPSGPPAMVF